MRNLHRNTALTKNSQFRLFCRLSAEILQVRNGARDAPEMRFWPQKFCQQVDITLQSILPSPRRTTQSGSVRLPVTALAWQLPAMICFQIKGKEMKLPLPVYRFLCLPLACLLSSLHHEPGSDTITRMRGRGRDARFLQATTHTHKRLGKHTQEKERCGWLNFLLSSSSLSTMHNT